MNKLQEYNKTITQLNRYKCLDIFSFAQKELPHLFEKEKALENKINHLWEDESDNNKELFTEALQDYKRCILIIIDSMEG